MHGGRLVVVEAVWGCWLVSSLSCSSSIVCVHVQIFWDDGSHCGSCVWLQIRAGF